MKLTLICDQNQNAAATRLLDRVLKNAQKEDIVVLTPENATLWAEQTLVEKAEGGAISGILVTNPTRLCTRLCPNVAFASNRLSVMLVARAIAMQNLVAYKKSSQKLGFAKEIYEIIKLFSQSGIFPQDLTNIKASKAVALKLVDIKNIWQAYLSLLPSGVCDAHDKIKMLLQKAKEGFFAGKTIYFAGFDDVSRGMIKLVEEICATAKEVVVSVVEADNNKVVNSAVADEFLAVAQHLSLNTTWDRKNSLSPKLAHIAENLFAKNKTSQEAEGILVATCNNPRGEAEYVAEYILNGIRSGARYLDFEIVVPSLDKYEKYFQTELTKYEIPFFSSSQKSVSNHPLFRLVDEFFSAAINQSGVKDFVALNKNILLGNNYEDVCVYENFLAKYGIEYADLKKPLSVGKQDQDYGIASLVHKMVSAQLNLMPKKDCSVAEFIDAIFSFLQSNNINEHIKEYSALCQTQEEQAVSERAFGELETLFDEIKLALGDKKIGFLELKEIWENGAEQTRLKLVPQTIDCVKISDVSTSKHASTRNLIIVGAAQGIFPSLLVDNGLLTDSELKEIDQEYKIKVEPSVARVNELEKFKVCELFSLWENGLLITIPQKIGTEEQFESYCVKSLREICLKNGKPTEIQKAVPQDNLQMRQKLINQAKTVAGAKKLVAMARSRTKSNRVLFASADVFGSAQKALEKVQKNASMVEQKDFALSSKLFFKNGKTSISEIESYFACPYMHFVRYGLGVKDKEDASIHALDIGNFLHLCLEKMTNIFIASGYNLTDAQFSKEMKTVLTEIVKAEKYQAKVNALQLETLKNEACRLCYAVLKSFEKTGFVPASAEINFGKGGLLPAVSFDKTKVVLEGKIDRMDVCGNYARLIDYKTGQIDLSLDNLYYGKKVQLFAYLLSVVQDGKYKPAGVFYLPVRSSFKKNGNMLEAYKLQGYFSGEDAVVFQLDKDLSLDNPKSMLVDCSLSSSKENKLLGKKVVKPQSHILQPGELEKLADYSKRLMQGAICEMAQGEIRPMPLAKAANMPCEYCPFFAACKIDENLQNVRRAKDKIEKTNIIGEN